MSKREKIIEKILSGSPISFDEAKTLLLWLGYKVRVRGSHHTFTKPPHNVLTLTHNRELPRYQMALLREVLEENGYQEKKN